MTQGFGQNLNYVLMEKYGFFPGSGAKSEIHIPSAGNAYGSFTDWTKNIKCQISFDSVEVSQVL
ncbi:unnamed protein product [marine sediment metagenome]|uniref:Uncharacterized protein n=1 Tax=marine sediment metagenome TaxID=412755 RepID=X1V4G7_9ZZZZ